MSSFLLFAIMLVALGSLAWRTVPIWIDCRKRNMSRCLYWALVGILLPSRYWWGARIEAMSLSEREDVLARETAALGLNRADSMRCPLCGAEVPHAWVLNSDGRLTVAPGPVNCLQCDFRLDACRHCAHFLPGRQGSWSGDDITFGRCGYYKVTQLVEQACSPGVARQLKARGYDQIRAPSPIVDSYVPLDFCMAFRPDRRRLRASGIRWPDARRVALCGCSFCL